MAYTTIEGYLCDRCGYRWASRNGTGVRDKNDPRVCANCKSPYWNRPRTNRFPKGKWADRWAPRSERGDEVERGKATVAQDSA